MACWNCKYFSYVDYRVDEDGQKQPYGCCTNEKSEDFNEKVPEEYECDDFDPRIIIELIK